MAIAAATLAPAAIPAALNPGTPVPTEPGVPGNGRAWELVTWPDTTTALITAAKAIALNGDVVYYTDLGPLPGAERITSLETPAVARRSATGWVDTPIAAPEAEALATFQDGPTAINAESGETIWWLDKNRVLFRGEPDGSFLKIAEAGGGDFRASTPDLRHVLFTASEHLLSGDGSRTSGLSVYDAVGSEVRLVDVANDGSLLSDCGSTVSGSNPISRDGKRIFFTTSPGCTGPARAYVREDGLTTREVSPSRCTVADCGPEADISVVGATPSGSSVFLVTEQRLTNDDIDSSGDLYRYDLEDEHLALLSAMPGSDPIPTRDSVLSSDDGTDAVFWAEEPTVGAGKHLYVSTPRGTRLLTPATDQPEGGPLVQITPNGRYVLFATPEQLAPDDRDESVDVYRYDADRDALTLISIGPTGGNGPFNATLVQRLAVLQAYNDPPRAMSNDGSEIFFGTADPLLPQDHNNVEDVYEWHEGSLDLISSGNGDRQSTYMGSTPDGKTVLFRTSVTLLPADRDGGDLDFYVARVGGGFPEASTAPPCQGERCPLAAPVPLERPDPASAGTSLSRIELKPLSARERRRIVATGWMVILAEVPAAGSLSASAKARFDHRVRRIAATRVKVERSGPVRLRMRLSKQSRRALAAGRSLHVRVLVQLPAEHGKRAGIRFILRGRR